VDTARAAAVMSSILRAGSSAWRGVPALAPKPAKSTVKTV
jgi:hypothetical protein